MAKKVEGYIKLQIPAGKATPKSCPLFARIFLLYRWCIHDYRDGNFLRKRRWEQ